LFTRYALSAKHYLPLPRGLVLKSSLTLGLVESLSSSSPVPVFQRYYLGGIDSLRGYEQLSVGPKIFAPSSTSPDAALVEYNLGGTRELVLNLDLEFPLYSPLGLRGVVFYDAGNALGEGDPFSV